MEPGSIRLPEDFSGQVRLFPLPNLVLFPNNVQPLHIFESRYREMLEDAVHGDRLIALATLEPGYEADYYSRPPIARQVCLGLVLDHEKTEEGTYHIVLIGMWRARIEEEILPARSFRRARVQLLDETSGQLASAVAQQLGRDLADRLLASLPAAAKLVRQFHQGQITLGALTDIMAFHLPLDRQFKLQLLAETNVLQRARWLLSNLSSPVRGADQPPEAGRGFSEN